MRNARAWEDEYKNSRFVTKHDKPQKVILKFLKYLKKQKFDFSQAHILDLGCGTGRNSIKLAELGATVIGYDISATAIALANQAANNIPVNKQVNFAVKNIGSVYSEIADASIDLILDVTASNALNEAERNQYLAETFRVLKPGGYFFVRALCKDGDANAKKMLKQFPGKEYDTYIMPGTQLTERVFSREDFLNTYANFTCIELFKTSSYSKFNNQSYKRNFWVAYLQK